ncbi:hypothetical protein KDW_48670 [Dictyobacter vulcani]|uniref:Uncharacterized protein n=1 Tax=Dictyobacter vulcani TaxID=2607529 RepID=A0A5J4KS25_9CHLR|nr:hypothetical protein [Dictyobacter vulcani]GER90705.1 hypothetical protein KDW_48670 [Dictyobacter vulcani]
MLKQIYGRTLVIPMTLWHRPYFDEIMAGLRQIDPTIYHFCLTARKETLLNRLTQRQHEHTEQALAWINERIDRCLIAFDTPGFSIQIPTDDKQPAEIVAEILTRINSSPGI